MVSAKERFLENFRLLQEVEIPGCLVDNWSLNILLVRKDYLQVICLVFQLSFSFQPVHMFWKIEVFHLHWD